VPPVTLGIDTHAVPPGRLVVVAAAADGVSHPSHQRQHQADDEDDAEDQYNMGEGESRDEAREEQPEDDKDDSDQGSGADQRSTVPPPGASAMVNAPPACCAR
jgi:hypothetical protein